MVLSSLAALIVFTGTASVDAISGPGQKVKNFCECRNWRSEYFKSKAVCGKGNEWFPTEENAPMMYRSDSDQARTAICNELYYKLDTNLCVNMNSGKDNGTWCYTDVQCQKLNGGQAILGQLPWKKCLTTGRDSDPKFRDQSPEELEEFAKHNDLWLGGLVRFAYPGSRADQGELVNLTDFDNNTIPDKLIPKLKEFGNGEYPVWFDTHENASVPIVIVHGAKAWKVDKARAQHLAPGTWSELTCIVGC